MFYVEVTWDDGTWIGQRFRDYHALGVWLTEQWNERFEYPDRIEFPSAPPASPPRGHRYIKYGERLLADDLLWQWGHSGGRGRWVPNNLGVGYEHSFGAGDPTTDRHGRIAARKQTP